MKKLVKLVVLVVSIFAFASCTEINETEEQNLETQEIQLIDPDDDGTWDDDRQETKEKKTVKSIFLGIAAFLMVAMSLFHAPLKRYSNDYITHYNTYDAIIKKRSFLQDSLLNQLGSTLNIKEYKNLRQQYWQQSQKELKIYTAKKRKLKKENSFLGRSSFKFWLFLFGLVTLGFYFAIKSLIDDFKKELRTGYEFISIAGISVCLFWYYHLFFQKADDFYVQTYLLWQVLVAFSSGFFVAGLIKYFVKREKLLKDIRDLIGFIFKNTKKESEDKMWDVLEKVSKND